jgi:recombinational DNA repair protein (RecF pathway)
LYRQATLALDELCGQGFSPATLFWFELQALKDLGVAPDLKAPDSNRLWFDAAAGGIVTGGRESGSECAPLSAGTLQCLRTLLECETPSVLRRLRLSQPQIREIAGHLHRFTRWHLDLDLRSRTHALT